jgi:DNA-binding SARP family transcriptional activator
MIRYRLLGPFEPADGLPGGKPRAVLARLLLDAARVVPAETLVDSIWARPPPSAHKVLQVYVSQLRKALGAGAIETRAPGYLLPVEADEHDLGMFERLLAAADAEPSAERRARLLREALGLWRGPALAEFREEPFAAPAARRLHDLRLAALEQRADAELELGRHEPLVPELETLVEQEPLREGLRRRLMLALYRSGRQAEALERYREGRSLLVGALGLEPAPALQELEQAILRHDAALAEPRPARTPQRGPVVALGASQAGLLAPLCADGRELLLVEVAPDATALPALAERLEEVRAQLVERGVEARTACFTSAAPNRDVVRLASEQAAELLVLAGAGRELDELPGEPPCDLAVAARPDLTFEPGRPVLVPFGGGGGEWAALELGAWIARAHALPLRLLGTAASGGRRDASRLLASAALSLQRFAGTSAAPVLVEPGPEGILAEAASVVVASLPANGLGETRQALVEHTTAPLLLVRGGLRPGGLAPQRTLTRFSWSLREG